MILNVTSDQAGYFNTLLVENGIEVKELTIQHGGFEEYFIERIGR